FVTRSGSVRDYLQVLFDLLYNTTTTDNILVNCRPWSIRVGVSDYMQVLLDILQNTTTTDNILVNCRPWSIRVGV
ncbi:hypothetical protein J6590_088972, partial [Homalodisca vitripennis]